MRNVTTVEKPTEVKKKPVERKKSGEVGFGSKSKKQKLTKVKDPNNNMPKSKPKRPMNAYFIFMEEFAKEAGANWKALTDEEKKPYQDKAADVKAEYDKAMEAYNADNGERMNNVNVYEIDKLGDKVDRISYLPKDILVYLLSFVEMKTAGRTSLLSRRWRYVWTHSTDLDFEDKEFFLQRKKVDGIEIEKFSKWVNQVFISHRALHLNTLRIHFPMYYSCAAGNIGKWVKFALRKKVCNLELNLATVFGNLKSDPKESYIIHPYLCHHYGTLKSVHLKSLHLEALYIEGALVENVLSNCLNVERLTIRACCFYSVCPSYRNTCKKLVVSSLKLKHLEYSRCHVDSLQISAPQLTSLVLIVNYKAYKPEVEYTNVSSLVDVTLISAYCFHISRNLNIFSKFSYRLKKLSLYWNRASYTNSGFPNLHIDNLLRLTSLIEACPLLHAFKLEVEKCILQEVLMPGDVKDAQINHVMRAHEHLKVVEFVGFDGSERFSELAIYLTQHAPMLKKIILDPRYTKLRGGYIHILLEMEDVDGYGFARRQAKLLAKRLREGVDVVIL